MLATATHDHKRGEDARARLAVLSELPERWRTWYDAQAAAARRLVPGVAEPDVWMLLQSLVGAWPIALGTNGGADARRAFADRIVGWQRKALREGKQRSSWLAPRDDYEARCERLVRALLEADDGEPFRAELHDLVVAIAGAAMRNSLVQLVLRTTSPGVPDLFQGTEYPDLSLVDPDNRAPVDFVARAASLARFDRVRWRDTWHEPAAKQAVLGALLHLRARRPALFAAGGYEPLHAIGSRAGKVLAFVRRLREEAVLVVVALRTARIAPERPWLDRAFWADTALPIGAGPEDGWRDALDGCSVTLPGRSVALLLGDLPVAVLERGDP
jgi:(1->4)-alpha-D-glucan 1-alpha-D-glucosylmutase